MLGESPGMPDASESTGTDIGVGIEDVRQDLPQRQVGVCDNRGNLNAFSSDRTLCLRGNESGFSKRSEMIWPVRQIFCATFNENTLYDVVTRTVAGTGVLPEVSGN